MSLTDPSGFAALGPNDVLCVPGWDCARTVLGILWTISSWFGPSDPPPKDHCATGGPVGCIGKPPTQHDRMGNDQYSQPGGGGDSNRISTPIRMLGDSIFGRAAQISILEQHCIGACHGNLGMTAQVMTIEEEYAYRMLNARVVKGTFSAGGAITGAMGCVKSGVTCGLAAALALDSVRQFYAAVTFEDPVITGLRKVHVSDANAMAAAGALDMTIGVFSITRFYYSTVQLATLPATSGAFGSLSGATAAWAFDTVSIVNTVDSMRDGLGQVE